MLEKATIARPYAQAAFEFARDAGEIEQWSSLLKLLADIVMDPGMERLLHNPKVTDEQLEEIVVSIGSERIPESGRNFIRILVESERLQYAPAIAELFEIRAAEAEGRLDVEIVSAYPLEDEQQQSISSAMARRHDKKIRISSKTDDYLIGGAIIRAGDSVIDASIRGRLNELRNDLT